MQRTRTMNDLTVITNRLNVIVDEISSLAGPIKENCTHLFGIMQKISSTYKLKSSDDLEIS
jgi:hypothetical protein